MSIEIGPSMKPPPFTLEILAAEEYFITISQAPIIKCLSTINGLMGHTTHVGGLRRTCEVFISRMNAKWMRRLSTSFDQMIAHFDKELKALPSVLVHTLRLHTMVRAEQEAAADVDLLFQLLLSDTLVMQGEFANLIMLLGIWGKKFPSIKTLVSYEYSLCHDLLDVCLPMLPNLTELKANVSDKLSSLRVIRDHGRNLETLSLPRLHISAVKNDDMCRVFFCGIPLSTVMERFSEGELLPLSFTRLKYLALPFRFPICLSFFRMLMFYYSECHFEWKLLEDDATTVSLFDAILCPVINLNPNHQQRHCELRFEDLRFTYVDEVLAKWTNLCSLLLVISKSSTNLNHEHAHSKLRTILGNCKKLESLQICTIGKNCVPCFETVVGVCKEYGGNIRKLCLMDYSSAVSPKQMVALLNCFSNVSSLTLICAHRHSFNEESINVSCLRKLKKVCVIIKDTPISPAKLFPFSLFISAILKQCPNVTDLTLPMDYMFLAMLEKLRIESQLCSLTLHLCSALVDFGFLIQLCRHINTTSLKEVAVCNLSDIEYSPMYFEMFRIDNQPFNKCQRLAELIICYGILMRYHDREFGVNPW